ncbi:MAG: peptide deformylase [Parcubacteria group bacterium]|jgi:peptide deformylase|nr:peptide deformylase [Parcubacteria group bacterium]
MNEIVQKENKVLRQIAQEVSVEDIRSRKIETIIRRMIKALNNQDDGVAIAAPQIGENLRIFVISKKIFEIIEEEQKSNGKKSKRENLDEFENSNKKKEYKDLIFINPEIIKISKKKMKVDEGCLSVRWLYGKVERAEKITVRAYDENGKPFTMGASGLLAQAFQHEIDHLNGILFIDKATDLKEMIPEETE